MHLSMPPFHTSQHLVRSWILSLVEIFQALGATLSYPAKILGRFLLFLAISPLISFAHGSPRCDITDQHWTPVRMHIAYLDP
jgi:hypothetical protein